MPPLRVAAAALALLLSCCCLTSAEPDAYKAALLTFLAGVGRGAATRARINWPAARARLCPPRERLDRGHL